MDGSAVGRHEGAGWILSSAGRPDIDAVWAGARRLLGMPRTPGEDLHAALIRRFVGAIHVEDPASVGTLARRPVLYLANHQTMVESALFMLTAWTLFDNLVSAVTHVQHRESWQGWLLRHHFAQAGAVEPGVMFFFDDHDQAAFMRGFDDLRRFVAGRRRSLLVHVDGTRVQSCRHVVTACSGVFLRLALAFDMPVVPVRFRGGLPVEPQGAWFDFPIGYGRQDYWIGRPILPAELAPLSGDGRRALVLDRLNALGGGIEAEQPNPPDPDFAAAVEADAARWGVPVARAVIARALAELPAPHPAIAALVDGIAAGRLSVPATAEGRWLADLGAWLTGGGLAVDAGAV